MGGCLVYLMCSLNLLENEFVVVVLLKCVKGFVEFVDVSKSLFEFKRRSGMKRWKVGDIYGWYDFFEEIGKKCMKIVVKMMFWN